MLGPTDFDFSLAQLRALEHAFKLISATYRKSFLTHNFGQVTEIAPFPDPDEVKVADPSEAVRSSDILSVLALYFDIVALNLCGGTLLQFLLSGIAGNFREDDAASMSVLRMLFAIGVRQFLLLRKKFPTLSCHISHIQTLLFCYLFHGENDAKQYNLLFHQPMHFSKLLYLHLYEVKDLVLNWYHRL